MSSRPLVSVIIPVYNGTNYLADAVESVLEQTYENVELVAVDDGSTDGTWELIQSYGDSLRGIHKENGGVASALNRGLAEADGRYIAWLSHDDLFLPDKLERQVEELEGPTEARACYTDSRVIDSHGATLRDVTAPSLDRAELRRYLFGRMFINGSTMLIDRECFDRLGGFREDLKTTQDAEMWFRILDHWEIGRVPGILGLQRTHPGQGSQETGPHIAEKQTTFTEIFDRLGFAGLFPELADRAETPRAPAEALVWFGDTMALHRYWFEFADLQYRRAAEIWPSWANPARRRTLVGARAWTASARWYRRARHELGVVRQKLDPTR